MKNANIVIKTLSSIVVVCCFWTIKYILIVTPQILFSFHLYIELAGLKQTKLISSHTHTHTCIYIFHLKQLFTRYSVALTYAYLLMHITRLLPCQRDWFMFSANAMLPICARLQCRPSDWLYEVFNIIWLYSFFENIFFEYYVNLKRNYGIFT